MLNSLAKRLEAAAYFIEFPNQINSIFFFRGNWGKRVPGNIISSMALIINRLISTGLEPVLSHTKKSLIAFFTESFEEY